MKNVSFVVARPIRIVSNGAVKGDKWSLIVCAKSGIVLHCGQPKYIRRIAAGKYNALVKV